MFVLDTNILYYKCNFFYIKIQINLKNIKYLEEKRYIFNTFI